MSIRLSHAPTHPPPPCIGEALGLGKESSEASAGSVLHTVDASRISRSQRWREPISTTGNLASPSCDKFGKKLGALAAAAAVVMVGCWYQTRGEFTI